MSKLWLQDAEIWYRKNPFNQLCDTFLSDFVAVAFGRHAGRHPIFPPSKWLFPDVVYPNWWRRLSQPQGFFPTFFDRPNAYSWHILSYNFHMSQYTIVLLSHESSMVFLGFLPPRFHVFSGFTENMFTSHVINMAGRLSHSEATAVSHVLRSWCHNLGEPLYGGYNMNITIVNGFITVYNCSWWLLMDVYGF